MKSLSLCANSTTPSYQGEHTVYANLNFIAEQLLAASGRKALNAPQPIPKDV
ncbi:MAG: hypothetical protein U5M23_01520 [Marinagarivorans sp.]|nr:hypothetical protein [Marinagarivorans sp.]